MEGKRRERKDEKIKYWIHFAEVEAYWTMPVIGVSIFLLECKENSLNII